MKAIPLLVSRIIRRVRIIYDGESGPIETEALLNGSVTETVRLKRSVNLSTNDNRKKSAIEL